MNIKSFIHKINQRLTCPLSKQEMKMVNDWDKLYITSSVVKDYRRKVKNNQHDNIDLIKKKLTRNMILGEVVEEYDCFKIYEYGNLMIWHNEFSNAITEIHNRQGDFGFEVDENRKQWIENYLQI